MNTGLFLCLPITETQAGQFFATLEQGQGMADVIELRLDYLPAEALSGVIAELQRRTARIRTPLLLTFRPREQGGRRDLSLDERQRFWRGLPREIFAAATFADFEFDLVESFAASSSPVPWEKVICSWHNFDETPLDLIERYDRMARTPAAIIKLATQANSVNDCLRIFDVIEHAKDSKPIIALGMGLPGLATRVLALSRGAMLTFGALRRGAESASGQPTVEELTTRYRVKQLSRESEIFGVIGKPVGHSRSPLMHNAALAALGRDGVYLPFEVDDLDEFVHNFVRPATRKLNWRLRGLSITIPHKVAITPHLDAVDATAERIGAVNTVVVEGNELRGYNTDCAGAMKPLAELMELRGARAAVIGAGGSARAICYGLRERGADVTIYARDAAKARSLAEEFEVKADLLDRFAGHTDVVINCTPIGMSGHSEGRSPVNAEHLRDVRLVYDLVYNPEETALIEQARAAGCQTLSGLAMLVGQAAEQFRLWTGLEAPVDTMWRALKQATSP